MPDLACEGCGDHFRQGQGRPARRCPRCRGDASQRYGPTHRALVANRDQAAGQACTRCKQVIREGQAVSPDHVDGGGPAEYAGWAHASCNHSAGAAYGNRLRAAAYRALAGAIVGRPPADSGSRVAGLRDGHSCTEAGCHADPERCSCGRHSRGW